MVLYPYQQRVRNHILQGKSVILQAPTGAGKTRAALAPFIEGFFDQPDSTPRKCLYVTPMRVLANQFYAEYRALADSYCRRHGRHLDVRIQTGEQPDDRRFEGDLIFCTIDQFLSSYLVMPYSLPYRLANLNAGAIAGSYLVFDEFHLFDSEAALPTILHALPTLSRLAPVMLMTATFSIHMLKSLTSFLPNAEIVTLTRDEITAIDCRGEQSPRQRYWTAVDQPLCADAVLQRHQRSSLVICNTVTRARALYRELKQKVGQDTELLLLHSQFLPDDRRRIEGELQRRIGVNANRTCANVIVVATQAIEVGVDISAEVLHTELAPPASLIQRAGRCARYPGEKGEVIVYRVEKYAPYAFEADELLKQEMDTAWQWLHKCKGEIFDFTREQELVNTVSAPRDKQVIDGLNADRFNRSNYIHICQQGNRCGASRLLVRDVDSRLVLIHPNPDQLLDSPYDAIGLNIPVYSLRAMVQEWLQRSVTAPWRVKRLYERQSDDRAESRQMVYHWVDVQDTKELGETAILVVHPVLAGYSEREGFLPDTGDLPFVSSLPSATMRIERALQPLQVETYTEHIQRVLQAFSELALPELRYAAPALERAANWPEGSVIQAAWLACLLHDVGKLSSAWQQWAHAYQQAINQPVAAHVALAHTAFDRQNPLHVQAQQQVSAKIPRPRHASEGALACKQMITEALGNQRCLTKATITAIARHHAPFVNDCQPFQLVPNADHILACTVQHIPSALRQHIKVNLLCKQSNGNQIQEFGNWITTPRDQFGWMAYTLLVRALRRADQRGTELGRGAL
ncbi:CRISPR-associated helicase Cas3' [Chloroflexus sp.]|uniref:CRISPR-associated helicase Cas3' n=1 Tax=Chloroflexus sp. TaxID=1904827 RepID=UPI003C729468